MEENKNKQEELQTRREFFKKAAKGVLPVLAIITLPHLFTACDKDLWDDVDDIPKVDSSNGCSTCSSTCQNGCKSICAGGSVNNCSACKGYCKGTCSYGCGYGASKSLTL